MNPLIEFLGEKNPRRVKTPSHKDHLPTNGACIDRIVGKGVLMNWYKILSVLWKVLYLQ